MALCVVCVSISSAARAQRADAVPVERHPEEEARELVRGDLISREAAEELEMAARARVVTDRAARIMDTPNWNQILAAPRIGDRLSAVAVDPRDANVIYVGTEEGMFLRSGDGGFTWTETALHPFIVLRQSLGIEQPTLGIGTGFDGGNTGNPAMQGGTTVGGRNQRLRSRERSAIVGRRGIGAQEPAIHVGVTGTEIDLLESVVSDREDETTPVLRITVCPGGRYSILVATDEQVFASYDEGQSFVVINPAALASPFIDMGEDPIHDVQCNPRDPNEIIVATSRGILRSTDGAATFTESVHGMTGGAATAIAWDTRSEATKSSMVVAMETQLFLGDPESEYGLEYIYPEFENPSMAPYLYIRRIAFTPSGRIWIATDAGVRATQSDDIVDWTRPGWGMFSAPIKFVVAGTNETGGDRVVITEGRNVWSTDDGGVAWYPFFSGVTRRTIRQVAFTKSARGEPIWFVLTSGELWRSDVPSLPSQFVDPQLQSWARRKLHRTPPLINTLDASLEHLRLRATDLNNMRTALRDYAWMPRRIAVHTYYTRTDRRFYYEANIPRPDSPGSLSHERVWNWDAFRAILFARWDVGSVMRSSLNSRQREALYFLQQQTLYVIEDAWHERRMHLTRLVSSPLPSRLSGEILRERVGVLEAVLRVWCGKAIEQLPRVAGAAGTEVPVNVAADN